jgi:tRNA nucleotidyltransferase (CCA-adding enzyme)
MHVILCHTTADFDSLGAAIALSCLIPGSKVVLPGGAHPGVRNFLALHRNEYPIAEARSIDPRQINELSIVDTQQRGRLGKCGEWLDLPQIEAIHVYDHHLDANCDLPTTGQRIEAVGATTTMLVEMLQARQMDISIAEATVMALAIHVDTGSLTFLNTTPRDALALAWLLSQGAQVEAIAEYREQGLSPEVQQLLPIALQSLHTNLRNGYQVSWVLVETGHFISGLSSLAAELVTVTDSDVLLLGSYYPLKESEEKLLTIIGRSRIPGVNLSLVLQEWGGGGHDRAAALNLRTLAPQEVINHAIAKIEDQIPEPITARDLMSSPVRTIRPDLTIGEAQRILLRYGHSGLCIVEARAQETPHLVGVISRRDLDLAFHHGFAHAPVKGYMKTNIQTINPTTTLPEIEELMVTYDIGRLPVLREGELVGIVTRTDVLRHRYQMETQESYPPVQGQSLPISIQADLQGRLLPELWNLLSTAAKLAQDRGWQLYLVGGAVRDLLLAGRMQEDSTAIEQIQTTNQCISLQDIDLVVDGFDRAADDRAGVELAQAIYSLYPASRMDVHGQFQTAALLWHQDPILGSLWIDIATARTEFYPYPAANPEVEASSIQQDLYRRDFTINALAIRLTQPRSGELLDFFGGLLDLQSRQIRVLHANSFIEDPTRIYRGVRFAVRLGFEIEAQTEAYIQYAIASGVFDRTRTQNTKAPALQTRLRAELKYILQTNYWLAALEKLNELDALKCLHPDLKLNSELTSRLEIGNELIFSPDLAHLIPNLDPWLIRLEILLTDLPTAARVQVTQQLQLPDDSIDRATNLDRSRSDIITKLESQSSIGEIVYFLQAYHPILLLLIVLTTPAAISSIVGQYLTNWSRIKAPINGHDLKTLGYQPGSQYKQILDAVLIATLDGVVIDRDTAIEFVREHYPRS